MIDLGQEMEFAAAFRQASRQFRVANGAQERQQATQQPNGQHRKAGLRRGELVAQRGEHAGTHHVGDDDRDSAGQVDSATGLLGWHLRRACVTCRALQRATAPLRCIDKEAACCRR